MIDEYEYTIIKTLIKKVETDIVNFTTIDDTTVMDTNGYMSIHLLVSKIKQLELRSISATSCNLITTKY